MGQVKLVKVSRGLNILFVSGVLAMVGMLIPLLGLVVICANICALFFMYDSHKNYMFALFAMLLRTAVTVYAAMNADRPIAAAAGVAIVLLSIFETSLICLTTEQLLQRVAVSTFPTGNHVLLVTLIARAASEVAVHRPAANMLAMMGAVMMLVSAFMAMVFYFRSSRTLALMEQEATKEPENPQAPEFYEDE